MRVVDPQGNGIDGVGLGIGVALEEWVPAVVPPAIKASQVVDNLILGVALEVRDRDPKSPTILVTKDVNLRIRADALGLQAEEYNAEAIDVEACSDRIDRTRR